MHLSREEAKFLFHMQQRHGLTTPLFQEDLTMDEMVLAEKLVAKGLLSKFDFDELDKVVYSAPQPSYHYYGRTTPLLPGSDCD